MVAALREIQSFAFIKAKTHAVQNISQSEVHRVVTLLISIPECGINLPAQLAAVRVLILAL